MGEALKAIFHPIRAMREKKAKKLFSRILVDDYDRLPKSMHKLASLDHPITLVAFVNLLNHNYPEVRSEAIEQVGYKKGYLKSSEELRNSIYKKMTKLVFSKDSHTREAAVAALGRLDDPAFAVSRIKRLLEIENVDSVVIKIIDVLARYRDRSEGAKTCLNGMLSNPEYIRYYKEVSAALVKNNY